MIPGSVAFNNYLSINIKRSIKASLMVSRCEETGYKSDLAKANILSHANCWTVRLLNLAWLNKSSINENVNVL